MLLQRADTGNGGAAGRADGVLQRGGVVTAFQCQLCRAQQHLCGVALGLGPGQTGIDAAVGQRLQKQVRECAAAAGHGAARVHQLFLQLFQQAGAVQQGDKALPLGLRHIVGAAVQRYALTHRYGGIGHDADHRIVAAGHFADACHRQARRHAQQHKGSGAFLQGRCDLGEHPGHHLGFDTQQDIVTLAGDSQVVRHGGADLVSQLCGFLRGAVGQHDVAAHLHRFGGGPGQCTAHVAGANESIRHKKAPSRSEDHCFT